jgi:ElaB/YqjD/DUF883 family membrane-anchored ribosome-binding protein
VTTERPGEERHSREELGETIEAPTNNTDVKARAQDKVSDSKQVLQEKGEQLKEKAVELGHRAQEKAHEVTPERAQQAAGQAVEKAQQTAKERPGLVAAVAAGVVAAGLLLRKLFRRRK